MKSPKLKLRRAANAAAGDTRFPPTMKASDLAALRAETIRLAVQAMEADPTMSGVTVFMPDGETFYISRPQPQGRAA